MLAYLLTINNHSTETTLSLSLLHSRSSHQCYRFTKKISCLCLLDLPAALDTTDHNILITRLSSWFGIHGSVLNWFKSYLSSCSFCVKCNPSLPPIPVCVVFPKVLFLAPSFHYVYVSS